MNKDVIDRLLANENERMVDLILGMISIVDALKRQPGFDTASFEREMRERAAQFPEQRHVTLRAILQAAANDVPQEAGQSP